MKCSGASFVVSSRASNAGKAAPATAAPTMSGRDCDTPPTVHQVLSHLAHREVVRGSEGGREDWAPTSRLLMVRFARAVSS